MSDLSERVDEPDETKEFTLSDAELESVDLDTTESLDAVEDKQEEEVDPIFDDDEEVLNDNLGYEE